MSIQPIPEGYHTVTPYLVVADADALLGFLERAFDAKVQFKAPGPEGKTVHAEVQVGSSKVMIGRGAPEKKLWPAMLYLYVPDVDATYARALSAGGKSVSEPADQYYGDRHGAVEDASGCQWWIATHIKDVTPEEMAAAAKK